MRPVRRVRGVGTMRPVRPVLGRLDIGFTAPLDHERVTKRFDLHRESGIFPRLRLRV